MKKIILLFLLIGTTITYGQTTLANKLKITSNVTSTTSTKVNVQEADGVVNTKPLSDFMQLPDIAGKENQFNKQNSLATDGTSVKYPTVDAVRTHTTDINNPHSVTKTQVGLSNVDNTSDVNKPNSTATQTALNLKENLSNKGIENGYASLDAAGKVPLLQINDALLGSVNYKGTYNASTNVPALPTSASGNKGFYFIVSTAGTQVGLTLQVGDWVISNGVSWGKVDNNNAVTSVNGLVGSVVLTTTNVAEALNKRYQTDSQQLNNDAISPIQAQLNTKALSNSPAFTGIPTALTAIAGTNTTQLATTAFVLANSSSIPQLENNSTDLTVWNNGKGNVATNTSFGDGALKSNTTGFNNTALGQLALSGNTTGNNNIALGAGALANLTNGDQNTALGNDAGSVNGSSVANNSSSNSLFLGRATKSLSGGQNNEIVIGDNATGAGSNTATLGNTSITSTILRGAVTTNGSFINSTAPATNALLAGGTTLANPISGTGTTNFLTKFTGTGTVGNSIMQEASNTISVVSNQTTFADSFRIINSSTTDNTAFSTLGFYTDNSITNAFQIGKYPSTSGLPNQAFIYQGANAGITFSTNAIERVLISASGVTKINNLSGTGSRVVTADASGNLSATKALDSRPYKVYTALLSQTGTAVPTAVILENTLGGTVVWTRAGTGSYIGTLTGVFTNLKTWTTIGGNYNTPSSFLRLNRSTLDIVSIVTESGGISDNVLENTSIEIRVYN